MNERLSSIKLQKKIYFLLRQNHTFMVALFTV